MEVFEIIAGACSILSLIVSIFVANKVIKINNNIKVNDSSSNVKVKGNDNVTSGRDSKITR